ncbi:hypothetical protein BC830DRAFT_1166530 [Chytriomyces sp. MP71]|nr:hypothetical protein BC830DRAFT_1166530 [Chytriomyces sp. MP71]
MRLNGFQKTLAEALHAGCTGREFRVGYTDAFQFHQDALNTFMVYTFLDLDANQIQLDRRDPDEPFGPAWSHSFGSTRRWMDNLLQEAVCGIHGDVSVMKTPSDKVDDAPLLQAFGLADSHWASTLHHGFGSPPTRWGTRANNPTRRHHSYATNNAAAATPSNRICKDTGSLLRAQPHGLNANDTAPRYPPRRGIEASRAPPDTRRTQNVLRSYAVFGLRGTTREWNAGRDASPTFCICAATPRWWNLPMRRDARFERLSRGLGHAYARVGTEASREDMELEEAVKGVLGGLAARRDSLE